MTTLRLVMLCSYYPPHVGGISSQVEGTSRALARLGVEVHVVTRQWEAATQEVQHVTDPDGIEVYRIALSGGRWQASPQFAWRSATLIRRLQPAAVHAHELLLPTTAALLAKRLCGCSVVVTVHSSGPELGECLRLQRATLGAQRVRYVRSAVDRFVAISKAVAADMEAIGVPAHKRVVIPNGIDMAQFAPLAREAKDALRRQLGLPGGVLVMYTGRLSSEKRVLPLAQQWARVRQAHPDATLVLVGDGPELDELRTLPGPGLLLAGAQEDVARYLQAADLFVMPSVSEGFSISTLEALACGLPAVATRVGAIPELLPHGAAGRLVAPDDPDALLDALCELLAQRAQWAAMGQAARSHVVDSYSLSSVAQCLLGVYRGL